MKYQTSAITFLLYTSFLLSSCNSTEEIDDTDKRPNVILIHSDELQFEDLEYYGGQIPTPNINKLAAEGLVFEKAYAVAPMCTPSRFSLLTGNYPGRCTHPVFIQNNPTHEPYIIGWNTLIDSSMLTLPRVLGQNGYQTGMVGKWHLGEHLEADSILLNSEEKDLKIRDELLKTHQKYVADKIKQDGGFDDVRSAIYENFDMFPNKDLHLHNFPWFTQGALDLIEGYAKKDDPFFLYLATTSLHGPHHAEGLDRDYSWTTEGKVNVANFSEMIERTKIQAKDMSSPQSHRYVGMQFLDELVGRVTSQLTALGIEDNTIIVFLPDHNTEPAKTTCYEKGLHIPLVVKWPSKIKSGQSTQARVQNTDIFPTILDLLGIKNPSMDGVSFSKALSSPADFKGRDYTYAESGYTRSISDGNVKYIAFRYPERIIEDMKSGAIDYAPNYVNRKFQGQSIIAAQFYPAYFQPDQLYDLRSDPYEQKNQIMNPEYQTQIQTLQQLLESHLSTFNHPFNLSIDPFIYSSEYKALVDSTKKLSPENIDWYKRDWGTIVWPPQKNN